MELGDLRWQRSYSTSGAVVAILAIMELGDLQTKLSYTLNRQTKSQSSL